MPNELQGKRVAALVEQGFEQIELLEPKGALEAAGATVDVVSSQLGNIRGWNHMNWGDDVHVDRALSTVIPDAYDALLVPGGVMSPDRLRSNRLAIQFVRKMFETGKPIAALCHAPWLLVEAEVVRGMRLASHPSIKTDVKNAGARWVDEEVVVDRGVVTSRRPDDLPAFIQKMLDVLAAGPHPRQLIISSTPQLLR